MYKVSYIVQKCHKFIYVVVSLITSLNWIECHLLCTALHCTAVHSTALHCTLHYYSLHCSALQCSAVQCSALHCTVSLYVSFCIGACISIGREIRCLPYAGFFNPKSLFIHLTKKKCNHQMFFLNCFVKFSSFPNIFSSTKSRKRETKNLSTDADSSTAAKKLLSNFF